MIVKFNRSQRRHALQFKKLKAFEIYKTWYWHGDNAEEKAKWAWEHALRTANNMRSCSCYMCSGWKAEEPPMQVQKRLAGMEDEENEAFLD